MANYNSRYTGAEIDERLGLAEKLKTMTIEGYERAGVYTDITNQATKREGEYVYQYMYDSSGVLSTTNADYNSYRLSVSKGEKYRIWGAHTKYVATVYLFNDSGVCVKTVPESKPEASRHDTQTIEIPFGVAYIVVNEYLPRNYYVKIEKFAVSDDLDFSSDMTIEGYKRAEVYTDITHKATKYEQYYIHGTTGNTIRAISITTYDYLELDVVPGEKYRIDTIQSATMHGCFFADAAGKILECYPPKSEAGTANLPFTDDFVVPAGASKLYVNQQRDKYDAKIQKAQTNSMNFVRDGGAGITSHLTGKKLACVGDSITQATNPDGGYFKNYAEIVAERNGMTVYKDGIGGSTMTNVEGKNPFCVNRYLNVPADFDILTIWFGWNDNAYATVGTIEDTTDTTYYGAYKKVLEYYITTYPTKKIGLIVPYGNSNVERFRVAVRELSAMYGVPCLDLADGKQCSLLWGTASDAQLARRAALTYDGTHPNQVGHEYLSTMYEAFIKSL